MSGPVIYTPEQGSGPSAYKLWVERLEATRKWRRKRDNGDIAWERARRIFAGHHWNTTGDEWDPSADNPRRKITVNITASIIQDFLPYLMRRQPEYLLTPKRDDGDQIAEQRARITSALLNHYYREHKMQRPVRAAVMDGLIVGHGIVKTGYMLDVNMPTADKPDTQGRVNYSDFVRAESPVIRRVDPLMFYFDTQGEDKTLDSARWAAEVFVAPLQDVLHNKVYHNKLRSDIGGGKENITSFLAYKQGEGDEEQINQFEWKNLTDDEAKAFEMVVLVEVWDKKFDKYYIFPWGVDRPLVEEPWKFPYLDGFPFAKFDFQEDPNDWYGTGLVHAIENQQFELDRIRTTEYDHRRKHGKVKYGVLANMMDEGNYAKLLSGNDEVVEMKAPPNEVVQPFFAPPLPSDNYQVQGNIMEDVRQLTGQDQLQMGGELPSRTTAREIAARQNIAGLKAQERIGRVDEFVHDIGVQLLQHLQANITTNKLVRIVGPTGQAVWEKLTVDEIKEEYDLDVISTSKAEHDPMAEREQRMTVFSTIIQQLPTLMQMGWTVNVPELLMFTLEAFDQSREKVMTFIQPAPPVDPMQQAAGAPAPPPDDAQQAVINEGAQV
jgi:hypothetical protein